MSAQTREPALVVIRTDSQQHGLKLMHSAARPFALVSVTSRPGRLPRREVLGRYTTAEGAHRAARRRSDAY